VLRRVQTTTPVKLARLVTEVFAPAWLIAVLMVLMGWHSDGYSWRGLGYGVVAALFEAVIPYSYILYRVRRGELGDRHIGDHKQRLVPLLIGLGCVLVGLVLSILLGAPREVLAGIGAGGLGIGVAALVNHWWKMSIHAAVAAGSAAILIEMYGPWLLATVPLVALVGWSRVVLSDHTVAQVIVGTVVGAVVAGLIFGLAR
jgi:hypothetical protein